MMKYKNSQKSIKGALINSVRPELVEGSEAEACRELVERGSGFHHERRN